MISKCNQKNSNFEICNQKYSGICDHIILNNMDKIVEDKKNNFIIFLTVNNHVPVEPVYDTPYINCNENFPLNLSTIPFHEFPEVVFIPSNFQEPENSLSLYFAFSNNVPVCHLTF